MVIKEMLDIDGVYKMVIEKENNEDFSNMTKFRNAFKDATDINISQVGNFTMKFTTPILEQKQPSRVYLIVWSDVCSLMRDGKTTVYSYNRLDFKF
jgi:hypothetical protein